MPPAALIFTWGATFALNRATSSRVAPAVEKPVEVKVEKPVEVKVEKQPLPVSPYQESLDALEGAPVITGSGLPLSKPEV